MANAKSNKRIYYTPQFPQKYQGPKPIVLKSGWEEEFARRDCDLNSSCLRWAYEPKVNIFYFDPISQSQKPYVPDFLITFLTPTKKVKTCLVEIKPMHEALESHVRNRTDYMMRMRNVAKWQAAMAWCARRGIEFRVLTEAQLFNGKSEKDAPKRPYKPKSK
jgi:hypothetical protein